uniref:OCEL domain-containing protein n=1 Tax=Oncorhynchus mykiss TaxID=8022 RepID=A0A8C7LUY1_ONCMY
YVYPTIRTEEERDQYKAVFKDQYSEYKKLHAEVQAMDLDTLQSFNNDLKMESWRQFTKVRMSLILLFSRPCCQDPTFPENRERCEYLKCKLSHIKHKISEYNKVMDWNNGFS